MANLAASDITVTILNKRRENGRSHFNVKLAFGNGVLTYPAGGVPISKGVLGCPNVIESLTVYDSGTSGYKWSYDAANEKLVAMQAPAQTHSHDLTLKNAAVADSAGSRVNAGTNLLGANTGSDITVAGGGANGGVASATLAAAALGQPSTVAIAAQVLKCEVIGW
jgi:hypothetical protein